MDKFEYATIAFDVAKVFAGSQLDHPAFVQKLNEYGADGWELVNVFTLARHNGMTHEVNAVLKRRKA
jgi:hypothetical protein